ncbi:MAG: NAD(P)H-dependent flavin oxidoreductase [Magnetospiraceae bacterium]
MSEGTEESDIAEAVQRRWARGKAFLGAETAIMGGAMAWVSDAGLVSAISNGGGFGVLAAAAMPPKDFAAEIEEARTLTDRPFGLNIITLHPQFGDLLALCVDSDAGYVVVGGGLPPKDALSALKDSGKRVFAFAPSLAIAKRLVRTGVDALIIEGREAGGHVGPVSTLVLCQEIANHITEVPVFVAGGIGTPEGVRSCLVAGASGCQVGTRFAACAESPAHENFKKVLARAPSKDAIVPPSIDKRLRVPPVRAIANQAQVDFMELQRDLVAQMDAGHLDASGAQQHIEHFWAGRLRRAVVNGDVESGSVMAGQSVGLVKGGETAREIILDLSAGAS